MQDGGLDGRPGGVLEPKAFSRVTHSVVSPSSRSAWVSRRAPSLATGHLRAARPWCPGAGWHWCGGSGLWWCAGARGPCHMVPSCAGACGSDAGDPMAWQCQAVLLQRISETGGPLREHHSSSAQSSPISGISILGGRGRASHAWSPPSLSCASLSGWCDNGRPALHLATVLPGMKSSKFVAGNTFYKPKVSVDTRGRFQLSPTFVRKERDQGCLRE